MGKVSLTYRPKVGDLKLVSNSNAAAAKAEEKAMHKKFKREMTAGEKVDMVLDEIKTLVKVAKIKLSVGKSKFMKNLQVNETIQAHLDRADAMEEKITARVTKKDIAAKKDAASLIAEFKEN